MFGTDHQADRAVDMVANEELAFERSELRNLLNTIVVKMINGEGDEDLINEIINDVDSEGIGEAERKVLYVKLKEILTVFFGVEHSDETRVTGMIRSLIHTVYPDLFDVEEYASVDRVKVLKERIHIEINRRIAESKNIHFDVSNFVNNFLFEGGDSMDIEILFEKFALMSNSIPDEVSTPLRGVLNGMRGKTATVSRKVIAGALKKSVKHNAKEHVSDPRVAGLKDLLAFVESLERRKSAVSDFHILDYLRDYVDEDSAKQLMGVKPQTLSGAVVESRYNGNKLTVDSFTMHSRDEAVSKAVISSMSKNDFREISTCLLKIVKGEMAIEDLNLRTGIGASPEDVPLRILSYVIPALTIAKRFKGKYGKSPRVDFFTGQEGGIACNGMQADLVRANTSRAFQLTGDFVKTFFPDVADSFSLVDDEEWSQPQTVLMVEYLENILIKEAENGTDAHLAKIVTELRRRGSVYGAEKGEGNSLKYAAFHVICFRDIPTVNSYIDGAVAGKSHIVSVGCSSEKEFDYIRDVLTSKFSVDDFNAFAKEKGKPEMIIKVEIPNLKTRSSLIADTGSIPPYFLVKEAHDIGVAELEGLEPQQIGALFAGRIQRALTNVGAEADNDPRIISGSKSFIQGMSLVASVTGRDGLINFIHQTAVNAK